MPVSWLGGGGVGTPRSPLLACQSRAGQAWSASGSESASCFLPFLLGCLSSWPGGRVSAEAKWELGAHLTDVRHPAFLHWERPNVGADGAGRSDQPPSLGAQVGSQA